MATDFPATKNTNDQVTIGTKTYRWNGFAWDRYTVPVVTPVIGSGELFATITATWDNGNQPQYTNNRFTGASIVADDYATITITWSIKPDNFSLDKVIPLYESSELGANNLFLYLTQVSDTQYTFKYKPISTPAQLLIKAGSVSATKSDNTTTTLPYDVYSLSIIKETRPYVSYDIAAKTGITGSDAGVSIVDTTVSPQVTRKYIADGVARNLRVNFSSFKDVPAVWTETTQTSVSNANPYTFTGTDVSIGYAIGSGVTGTGAVANAATGTAFYLNTAQVYQPGTTTAAIRSNAVREIPLAVGTGATTTNTVVSFRTAANTYQDSGLSNVAGPYFYLGLFRGANIAVRAYTVANASYTGKIESIKFQLDHYRCLTQTGLDANNNPIVPIATGGGTLGVVSNDTTDRYGLSYVCTYTPRANSVYTETIVVPAGWKKIVGTADNKLSSKSSTAAVNGTLGTGLLTFPVNTTPIKIVLSNLVENFSGVALVFTADRNIAFTSTGAGVYAITYVDANNATQTVPTTIPATISTTTITIPLPTGSVLKGGTEYTVTLVTTGFIDAYGNNLDYANSQITKTFKVDSSEVTGTLSFDETNTASGLSVSFSKPLASILSPNRFISIVNNTTGQDVVVVPYSASTFTATPALSTTATVPTVLTYNGVFYPGRSLRVGNNYTLTLAASSVRDRFNNTNQNIVKTFTLPTSSLTVTGSTVSTTNKYRGGTILLSFNSTLYFPAASSAKLTFTNSTTNTVYEYTRADTAVVSIDRDYVTAINFTPPASSIGLDNTYSITLEAGFVEDYTGNQSSAYTQTFKSIALGEAIGQQEFTTNGTWTPPFGVNSVSIVAIGAGSYLDPASYPTGTGGGAGSLAWINNIPVTQGVSYSVVVGQPNSVRDSSFNGQDLIAGGGTNTNTRAHASINASLTTGKIAGTNYGTSDGGLSKYSVNHAYEALLGNPGNFTNGGHGTDYAISSYNPAPSIQIYFSSGGYGSPGSGYYYYDDNNDLVASGRAGGPGVVYIIWGPGRAFPSTLTNPQ